MMPRLLHGLTVLVIVVASAAGCATGTHYPRLRSPGPAKYQRANAEAFDPYPLPDLGPEIDGGRPREFAIPRNEVERAQDYEIVQAARRATLTPPMAGAVGPPTQFGAATTAPAFVPSAPITTSPAPVYTPTAPMPSTVPSGPRY